MTFGRKTTVSKVCSFLSLRKRRSCPYDLGVSVGILCVVNVEARGRTWAGHAPLAPHRVPLSRFGSPGGSGSGVLLIGACYLLASPILRNLSQKPPRASLRSGAVNVIGRVTVGRWHN
jgi:hypothetical protein